MGSFVCGFMDGLADVLQGICCGLAGGFEGSLVGGLASGFVGSLAGGVVVRFGASLAGFYW